MSHRITWYKKCSICKNKLPLNCFHKNKQQKDGHETRCKVCRSTNKGIRNPRIGITVDKNYKNNYYQLKIMFNPNYNNIHYNKYKEYYLQKGARIYQDLKWERKYPNILDEEIEWHHVNNSEVVAVPKDIHRLYCTNNREEHRENMKYIVKQIYGGD